MPTKIRRRTLRTGITFASTLALAAPAGAASIEFLAKLTAEDGAGGDSFGASVALDGTTALIGAPFDDDAGTSSGSVYLFDIASGAQQAKLTAGDGAAFDRFGSSVALDGTTALVGSFGDDDNGSLSGSAYLFDTTTGTLRAKLRAADGARNDQFGVSVALDGTTALVGADGDSSAYLFDATTGAQRAKITADDTIASDQFGVSVALDGTTVLVGAINEDEAGLDSGAAYLFDATSGTQQAKLTAEDAAANDRLGVSVALDGTIALAGAVNEFGTSNSAAYLFDTTTGTQRAKLTADDSVASDQFGIAVALDGSNALVGANFDDDSGSAYLFDAITGLLVAKLLAPDGGIGDQFGASVAVAGDLVLVGAPGADTDGRFITGAAYLFRVTDDAAVVPLPATVWLMLAGLGGFAVLRRRC